MLLIIDICTFFFTVVTTGIVKRGLAAKSAEVREGFIESFRGGWKAITGKRGVIILIMASAVLTCFMGIFQILAEPLLLDFTSSTILGIAETICACGMLLSSLLLGFRGIKKAYVKVLCFSLFLAGIAMAVFGLKENIYLIGTAGFCFFAMLPFANSCLDYLIRTNIAGEMQGRCICKGFTDRCRQRSCGGHYPFGYSACGGIISFVYDQIS